MKLIAVRCTECLDTIYSRARHDMRYCTCKKTAIDGGQDNPYYQVLGLAEAVDLEIADINIKVLYDDWNKSIDKYGLIRPSKLQAALTNTKNTKSRKKKHEK